MQRSLHNKNNIELIENGQGPMTHKVNFMCYLPNASNKETYFFWTCLFQNYKNTF